MLYEPAILNQQIHTMKIPEAFLQGEKCYLRAFRSGDESALARIENHPDPRSTLYYFRPITEAQVLERNLAQSKESSAIYLSICDAQTGEVVGQTALVRIDWVGRMATFYIGIADKDNWGKGYGSEATRIMLEYAFRTLNLNRVQLHVATDNPAGMKVYTRMGFVHEGTLREAMFHNGRFVDFWLMAVLQREWQALQVHEEPRL